jgi:hypothetical protein
MLVHVVLQLGESAARVALFQKAICEPAPAPPALGRPTPPIPPERPSARQQGDRGASRRRETSIRNPQRCRVSQDRAARRSPSGSSGAPGRRRQRGRARRRARAARELPNRAPARPPSRPARRAPQTARHPATGLPNETPTRGRARCRTTFPRSSTWCVATSLRSRAPSSDRRAPPARGRNGAARWREPDGRSRSAARRSPAIAPWP